MSRFAVIDLGTNTFHLLIADVEKGSVQVIHKEKRSVKIGENGISSGLIALPAQERAIRTLQGFKEKINQLNVQRVHATATSAFRNAKNGKSLALEILSQTGIKVEIIDGQKEAELIYQGVKQALKLNSQDALIVDIGGGSVEFIICNLTSVKWIQSFEIGAQRLMDKFHYHDPITTEEMKNLEHYLDTQLQPLAKAIDKYQPNTLIGASGTFDTLSQIYCAQEDLIDSDTSERPLTIHGFHRIHQDIIQKNRADRMLIPGMIEMRVDMIVVASVLINYVLSRFGITSVKVSSYALKEGLLSTVSKTEI